jgi:6-phosphofructokinase
MKTRPHKRIGVLTGGGDVPPLNAFLHALCLRAEETGARVIGFRKGWEGLISENGSVSLRSKDINPRIGGTVLKSSRLNLRTVPDGPKRVMETLGRLDVDALVVVGGEDTLSNAFLLPDFPLVLVSKTIDNDVGIVSTSPDGSYSLVNQFSLGFPTAVRKIASFVNLAEGLRTTAFSHERIMVVESMGMHAGWLALASALGDPDFIVIPEYPLEFDRFRSMVLEKFLLQKHVIVVAAEGARWSDGGYVSANSAEADDFGHPRFKGAADALCRKLKESLAPVMDTRNVNAVNPSYLYRSGAPCRMDALWAARLARKTVDRIVGHPGQSVFLAIGRDSDRPLVRPIPLSEIKDMKRFHRFVPPLFYDAENLSVTKTGLEYLQRFIT